ncbi:MAG: HEAT repeat domain-containing protein [Gemmatales bacterium]|nr:HEAT repeat domain-containing protein [Gemmatales bacterium]MDW7993323.1 HEAT repeat domain-containing protein [Gemmatales bacterium]
MRSRPYHGVPVSSVRLTTLAVWTCLAFHAAHNAPTLLGQSEPSPSEGAYSKVQITPEQLKQAFAHPDWRVRWWATQYAAQMGSEAQFATSVLARLMRSDPSPEVRAGAIVALAKVGGAARWLVPELVEYTQRPVPVGPAATWALGQLTTPQDYDIVIPALRQALLRPNPPVRLAATLALKDLGPVAREAVPDLLVIAAAYPSLRAQVYEALRNILPRHDEAAASLAEALQHPEPGVREQALILLRTIAVHAKPFVPAIARVLEDDQVRVRRQALALLADIGIAAAPDCVDRLARTLRDKDLECRRLALHALLVMGQDCGPYTGDVVACLKHRELRELAIEAVANIGRRALPKLEELLRDPDPATRAAAATAIGKMGPIEARPAEPLLLNAIRDPSGLVRAAALAALQQIGPQDLERGLPLLMERIQSGQASEQTLALGCLREAGAPAAPALPFLLDLLARGRHAVAVQRALDGICTDASVVPHLRPAFRSSNRTVRLTALQLAARFPEALAAFPEDLATLAQDPDPQIRQLANQLFNHLRAP